MPALTPEIMIAVVSLALLFFGRQLFPLFVGAVGFAFAHMVSRQLLTQLDADTALIISVLLGVFGFILAIQVQKLAIAVSGFLAGGFLAYHACAIFTDPTQPMVWVIVIVAGILGTLAMALMFTTLVAAATSAVAAISLASLVPADGLWQLVIFAVLWIFGMSFQLKRRSSKPKLERA